MATIQHTKNGPARKALVEPGKENPGAGQIKPKNPEVKKRKTGGGQLLKTPAEMAQACGFSKRTLSRLTSAKVVPVVRIGRLCFYRPEAVMAAIQRNCELREVEA
ncbi:MAG: helix-turn-helix domain-containing protein [Verrucomicrobiaceae bacterium]|nr:helix-turn-helix domain-containing protein [Verrucomicrobiaceae bacterium]